MDPTWENLASHPITALILNNWICIYEVTLEMEEFHGQILLYRLQSNDGLLYKTLFFDNKRRKNFIWILTFTVTIWIPDSSGIQMVDLCLIVKWSGIQMVVWKPDWKSLFMVQNVQYSNDLPSHSKINKSAATLLASLAGDKQKLLGQFGKPPIISLVWLQFDNGLGPKTSNLQTNKKFRKKCFCSH